MSLNTGLKREGDGRMKNMRFHFACDKCEEKSKRIQFSDIPFLSKHFDRNCPSEALKIVYENKPRLKINDAGDYEDLRVIELKNYLSKIRKILRDFVNMPNWKYGSDVENIIEETIKLRLKIIEDLENTEEETKDNPEAF